MVDNDVTLINLSCHNPKGSKKKNNIPGVRNEVQEGVCDMAAVTCTMGIQSYFMLYKCMEWNTKHFLQLE